MISRYDTAEWIELSGLPAELNEKVRAGAWSVFKKIVEIDCRRHRVPEAVEISLGELGARCGLAPDKVAKIIEALRKRKFLSCFLPDNPDEPGLFEIRVPLVTPRKAEEIALAATEPNLRDPTSFRYLRASEEAALDVQKVQKIVDLYLNTLSQKVNSFIVDEIEILSRRFPFEAIEKAMLRAAKHEIRHIGWVSKELIRDAQRPEKKGKSARSRSSGAREGA